MIRFACLIAMAGLLLGYQPAGKRRPVIEWERTNGPYGGGGRNLLVHGNQLLVPGEGGVWRSPDRGRSWRAMGGRFAQGWGLTQSGSDLFVHHTEGLDRTDTLGASWVTCGPVPHNTRSDRYLVPAGERIFYWIPEVGLFRSEDRCASWTRIAVPWDVTSGPVAFAVSRAAGTMFAMTVRGSFRTGDHGGTWHSVTSPRAQTFTSVPASGSGIIIGSSNGIYRSSDDGLSWTHLGFAGRWIQHMVATADGAVYVAVGSGSGSPYRMTVMRSLDDGNTWTSADAGLTGHAIDGLAHDDLGTLYLSSDAGVYQLGASGSWQPIGLPTFFVTSLFAAPWNDVYATGGPLGARRRNDRAADWRPILLPEKFAGAVTATSDGDLLMRLSDGLYRSGDRGETWRKGDLDDPNILTIFTVPSTRTILAGTNNGLFRSQDNGDTWIERSVGLRSFTVTSFAAGANGVLYAGTVAGEGEGHVYQSTNQGDSWRLLAPEFHVGAVTALAALPGGDVMAGTGSGLFRLIGREGAKWQEVELAADGTQVSSLVIDNGGRLIAGTERNGVFVSEDGGRTWTVANRGLPTRRIRAITAGPDGYIYAATGHAWRYGGVTDPVAAVGIFRGRFLTD